MEVKDFVIFLRNELERRQQRNSSYSMRSFAKFLGVDSSRLSKILRGKRPIGSDLLYQFAKKFELSDENVRKLEFRYALRKDSTLFDRVKSDIEFKKIEHDCFEIISDWRHYFILESLKLKGFSHSKEWVAQRLKISEVELDPFLDRLERVGLLVIDENGKWHDTSEGFSTHIIALDVTTGAHKRHQKDIFNMAMSSIDKVAFNERDSSSMMMATNKQKIMEAKELIKNFRRKLCDFLEDTDQKDSVYQLGISLYPLEESSD